MGDMESRPLPDGRPDLDTELFEEDLRSAIDMLPRWKYGFKRLEGADAKPAAIPFEYILPDPLMDDADDGGRARCEDLEDLTPFELYLEEVLTTVALAVAMAETRHWKLERWYDEPELDSPADERRQTAEWSIPWLRLRLQAIQAERRRRKRAQ